ncbi:MAG TPA: hypothetical protein P5043_00320 [Candidatus Paceibacterota bacterium]|nr:hypothetical protein [Candidatus Paceibacterota bacterium]
MTKKQIATVAATTFFLAVFCFSGQAIAGSTSGWLYQYDWVKGNSCGSGMAEIRVTTRAYSSQAIVKVAKIKLTAESMSTGQVTDSAIVSNGSSASVCLKKNDRFVMDIDGGGSYRSFNACYYYSNFNDITGRTSDLHVHLESTGKGIDYEPVGPKNIWINTDPTYQIKLDKFTPLYGTTGTRVIWIDDVLNGKGNMFYELISGGAGTYNVKKTGIQDGWHTWSFYIMLNGQVDPFNIGSPSSGKSDIIGFGLDRAKPTASINHSPVSVANTDSVTYTANGQDALSGLTNISIYVDGVLAKSCPFAGQTSLQQCVFTAGPYSSGSSHTYYLKATDRAGNVNQTPVKSFTVTGPACACTPWANGACAAGSCTTLQRQQTRTCNPVNCLTQSQCVADATCCVCTAWADDDCGLGTCGANQMRQTRTCNPAACDVESQCAASASCPRTLTLSLTANPNTGNAPLATTITGTVGGTAVGTINYTTWWDCDDPCATVSDCQAACGAWDDKADGQAAMVRALNHTYSAAGIFHPKMIVERHSLSASGSVAVTVINGPPSVSALVNQTDYCGSGLSTMFSWTYSDPENDPQTFRQIQVDDNSNFSSAVDDTGKVAASSTSYTVLSSKLAYNTTYYWRIKVWDSAGNNSGWVNGPSFTTPLHGYPAIDFSWTPSTPKAAELITYTDLTQIFGGSTIVSRSWEIDGADPNISVAESPAVTYAAKGDYSTKLTVTDSQGYTCSATKNITVKKSIPDWEEG